MDEEKAEEKATGKGLRADATLASIREEENTNRKTRHSLARFVSVGA